MCEYRERVLGYFGLARVFHSDNGAEFRNHVLDSLIERWKDPDQQQVFVHGRPRHPQSQGAVERANATVSDKLSARFQEWEKCHPEKPAPWGEWLPEIMCEYLVKYYFKILI